MVNKNTIHYKCSFIVCLVVFFSFSLFFFYFSIWHHNFDEKKHMLTKNINLISWLIWIILSCISQEADSDWLCFTRRRWNFRERLWDETQMKDYITECQSTFFLPHNGWKNFFFFAVCLILCNSVHHALLLCFLCNTERQESDI